MRGYCETVDSHDIWYHESPVGYQYLCLIRIPQRPLFSYRKSIMKKRKSQAASNGCNCAGIWYGNYNQVSGNCEPDAELMEKYNGIAVRPGSVFAAADCGCDTGAAPLSRRLKNYSKWKLAFWSPV